MREGWTRVAFGDVVRLSRARSSDPIADGFDRYVGLDHLDSGDLKIRRWGTTADGTTFTNVFRPGQVLFGKRRAYQRKVAVADFAGVCSGDIYVFEPNGDAMLAEYLPFVCQSEGFFKHALQTSAGSLSPRTNWINLAAYELVLPDRNSQRDIAHLLSTAHDAAEGLRRLKLEGARLHRSTLAHMGASEGWHPIELGSLISGITAGRSVSGSDEPPKFSEVGVLKVSAVDPEHFRPEESKRLLDQSEFVPEYRVRAGDLVITRANTAELVGEVCLVDKDYPNLMLCDKTLRLELLPAVRPALLLHELQGIDVRRQLRASATGTGSAMKNISQTTIRSLRIAYPENARDAADADARLGELRLALAQLRTREDEARALVTMLNARFMATGDVDVH